MSCRWSRGSVKETAKVRRLVFGEEVGTTLHMGRVTAKCSKNFYNTSTCVVEEKAVLNFLQQCVDFHDF